MLESVLQNFTRRWKVDAHPSPLSEEKKRLTEGREMDTQWDIRNQREKGGCEREQDSHSCNRRACSDHIVLGIPGLQSRTTIWLGTDGTQCLVSPDGRFSNRESIV